MADVGVMEEGAMDDEIPVGAGVHKEKDVAAAGGIFGNSVGSALDH